MTLQVLEGAILAIVIAYVKVAPFFRRSRHTHTHTHRWCAIMSRNAIGLTIKLEPLDAGGQGGGLW
jgi:hypothetical protein